MAERISQVLDTQTASRESTVDPNLYANDYTGLVEGLSGVADVVIENKFLDEMGAVADQESGYYDMWRGAVEGAMQANDVATFEQYAGVISNINSAEKQGHLNPYNAQVQQQSTAKKYISRFPHLTSKFTDHLAELSGDRLDRAKMLTEDPIVQEQQKIIAIAMANGMTPSEVIASNRRALQTQDLANRMKLAASDPEMVADLEVAYMGLADLNWKLQTEGMITGKMPIFGPGESGNLETVGYANVGKIDSLNFAKSKGEIINLIVRNHETVVATLRAGLIRVMADNGVDGTPGTIDMDTIKRYEDRLAGARDMMLAAVNSATTVGTLNSLIDRKILNQKHADLELMNKLLGDDLAAIERESPGFTINMMKSMQEIGAVESVKNIHQRGIQRNVLTTKAETDPFMALALQIHTPGSTIGKLFENVLIRKSPPVEGIPLPGHATTPRAKADALDEDAAANVMLKSSPPHTEDAQVAALKKWQTAMAHTGDDPSGKVIAMRAYDKLMWAALINPEGAKTPSGIMVSESLMDNSESWFDSRIVQDRSLAERLASRVSTKPDRIFGGDEEFPAPPLTSSVPGGGTLGLPMVPKAPSREIENVNEMYRLLFTRDPARAEEYKQRVLAVLGKDGNMFTIRVGR